MQEEVAETISNSKNSLYYYVGLTNRLINPCVWPIYAQQCCELDAVIVSESRMWTWGRTLLIFSCPHWLAIEVILHFCKELVAFAFRNWAEGDAPSCYSLFL